MASVATGPLKASFQCRYFEGFVLKSTCTRSPVSAMTPLAQDDPERLGLFATEILPPVGHAAVEERAVARLEQVAVAVVVERNLALQDVEELQLARLDDDLLGREAARLRTERRDYRADLALKEAGAEYGPPLRRPIERHHRVVALVRDDDAAGRLPRDALAEECRRGLLRRRRLGGDSAEHDASLTDHVALHPGRHGHPEHREIERAAPPKLQVHRAPALGRRQLDVGDDLVGTLGEVFDPVVLVERGHRHRALALRADYSQLRAERPEHRRGVRRGHGPAP